MLVQTEIEGIVTHYLNPSKLPLVIEPIDPKIGLENFLALLDENNDFFKRRLLDHGGILFRNFPVHGADDFSEVIKSLDTGPVLDYIGGDSPRKKIKEGIYTSTEAPPSIKIPLHNELSFVKNYPSHIYFYCDIATEKKGETIIASAKKVYEAMDPEIRKKFVEKGLCYISSYFYKNKNLEAINKLQPGCFRSWIQVFETESKEEVERLCHENEFEFEWLANDWLNICQKGPGVKTHPLTQETVWFNQAHIFDLSPNFLGWWRYLGLQLLYFRKHMRLHQVFYGDRTPISRKELAHVFEVLDANTLAFPWKKGDVLLLDNVLTMHGRSTFKGKRRILTAMT